MADTKRLQILKALTTLLETTPGVALVSRGRTTFGERDPLPRVTIVEALNPDREMQPAGDRPQQKDGWVLLLLGHAPDDRDNPTDPAHNLMGEVKKVLARIADRTSGGDFMLGGRIVGVDIEPGTVRPPDELSMLAYFYLRVRLTVVERLFDPFSL
jgi:hypothetical protein